jgi:hypothetical protein
MLRCAEIFLIFSFESFVYLCYSDLYIIVFVFFFSISLTLDVGLLIIIHIDRQQQHYIYTYKNWSPTPLQSSWWICAFISAHVHVKRTWLNISNLTHSVPYDVTKSMFYRSCYCFYSWLNILYMMLLSYANKTVRRPTFAEYHFRFGKIKITVNLLSLSLLLFSIDFLFYFEY